MAEEKVKRILQIPIEKMPLSIGTIIYLKQMGIKTLYDILNDTETNYEIMHKRIFNNSNIQIKSADIQKYYNEITDYLRYLKIKIKEETSSKTKRKTDNITKTTTRTISHK